MEERFADDIMAWNPSGLAENSRASWSQFLLLQAHSRKMLRVNREKDKKIKRAQKLKLDAQEMGAVLEAAFGPTDPADLEEGEEEEKSSESSEPGLPPRPGPT
jgi:hypothetical protein